MREAVIIATPRTFLGSACRDGFNDTPSPTPAAHGIRAVIARASIGPQEIGDVVMGTALQRGSRRQISRRAAARARPPTNVNRRRDRWEA